MPDYPQSWISLPSKWQLEDVQAALNVIITALSTLFMFVFVRFCWQHAAKRVARGKDIALYSLLSLNTVGEVFDISLLLRRKLVSMRYGTILAQCIVVLCLSTTAILSGPITRYSSRKGTINQVQGVSGMLATRAHNSITSANVEWNLTYSRLDQAGFPRDQLLDYLPDNRIKWVYTPGQWNNSWSMDCQYTPKTDIVLEVTKNCTGLRNELPGLKSAFSYSKYDNYSADWHGFYTKPEFLKDVLVFVHGTKKWDYVAEQKTYLSMSIMLTAAHLHGLPMAPANDTDCNFDEGHVDQAYYTKIECELRRRNTVDDDYRIAFPDYRSAIPVPDAYATYYSARFIQQSTSDSPISVITPEELARFYQAYTIVKDLQYRQPVTRYLSVEVSVVQLSSIFLAIVAVVALLTLLGLIYYAIFAITHRVIMATTPQSKLDWVMLSIQAEDRPSTEGSAGWLRRSVTVDYLPGSTTMSRPKRQRKEFEAAKYGGRETTTWFLGGSQANSEYSSSYALQRGIGVVAHGPARLVQNDTKPFLEEHITKGV